MEHQRLASLGQELSTADFGDKRLTDRLVKIVDSLLIRPESSFPEAANNDSELEGIYRFLGNARVTLKKILRPHIAATVERVKQSERVVVAHDSTNFIFGGKSRREEVGWLNQGSIGFLGHFALALDRERTVSPLGVVGVDTIFRSGKSKASKKISRVGKKDLSRESLRWGKLVQQVEQTLPDDCFPIHVMDREADDYELLSSLVKNKSRFIIRVRHDRSKCKDLDEAEHGKLYEIVENKRPVASRTVHLSNRAGNRLQTKKGYHLPRKPREAKLSFSAASVKVPRSTHLPKSLPEHIFVNIVHAYEPHPPKGEEAINWKLLTGEPIDQIEDILEIVDDYRARWMIEEYFKALKTGCSFQKRQVSTRETLLNTLAVLIPIAHQLLHLRTVSRVKPNIPANQILRSSQLEVLSATSKKPFPQNPTAKQALLGIAALGGHIPNNGPPGWLVIGRGMEKLLTMEVAWVAAKERCDQS